MLQTITVPVALTHQERARIREEETRRNEDQYRDSVRRKNLEAGKPDPKAGDKLYVATARGIRSRGRAGLQFSEQPAEVKVVDLNDAEVLKKQTAGAFIVNPWGAALIIADANEQHAGLIVFAGKDEASSHQPKALDDHELEALEAAVARKKAQARGAEPRIGSTRKGEGEGGPTPNDKGAAVDKGVEPTGDNAKQPGDGKTPPAGKPRS